MKNLRLKYRNKKGHFPGIDYYEIYKGQVFIVFENGRRKKGKSSLSPDQLKKLHEKGLWELIE